MVSFYLRWTWPLLKQQTAFQNLLTGSLLPEKLRYWLWKTHLSSMYLSLEEERQEVAVPWMRRLPLLGLIPRTEVSGSTKCNLWCLYVLTQNFSEVVSHWHSHQHSWSHQALTKHQLLKAQNIKDLRTNEPGCPTNQWQKEQSRWEKIRLKET